MKELDRNEALELASPYPYVLAVTLDKRDRPNIMGLSWWMYTSWNPMMIAISVSRERYSRECLEHHREFVLCFPSEGQERDAWICGTKSGKNIDKFQETKFRPVHSKHVKPPIIEGSTVAYECRIVKQVETGDHTVYIADVVAAHGNPERVNHLYSVHYTKIISVGSAGEIKTDLSFK
jgi:flavin reductase (DIM6/NTAB) family NADH-FMN oxidoreductase RutF